MELNPSPTIPKMCKCYSFDLWWKLWDFFCLSLIIIIGIVIIDGLGYKKMARIYHTGRV